jgi:RNA recognition motif-containing protein
MVTLYVGGLKPRTTESRVRDLFADFGEVPETRLVTNEYGECRGFAYVSFEDDLAAARARVALDGKQIDGHTLRVALAT